MDRVSATDTVIGWFRWRRFKVRHGARWRWRKLRGLTGEFDAPEDSNRARRLTSTWDRQWPGQQPLADLIRGHSDRWVRFHSLPESKRYADSETEYQEILRRQRTILHELLAGSDLSSIIVVAADWPSRDLASGDSRRHLPDAWPWRIGKDDIDHEAPPVYFWAQVGIAGSELNALLRAGADDQGRFLFADRDMTWLICPYDGGVDVILPTSSDRDSLSYRHAEWLPDDGAL